MWSIHGKPADSERFVPFVPQEVLYEFDGPRIFTLVDAEGELNLLPALEPEYVDVEGRVRELDKDRRSFELREICGPIASQRFTFDESLRDDVYKAFDDEVRVKLSGRKVPGNTLVMALALARIEAGTPQNAQH